VYSLYVALVIAFLQGVADMGWGIGSARLLYVKVVPPEKRTDYMAFYYAWIGIVGGVSQLSVGLILESTQGLTGQIGIFTIDQYLPLFLAGVMLPFVSFFLLRKVQDEDSVGIGQFAGIFLRGNPFLAMSSMIRYYLARDERTAVRVTERLGRAKSPLTVDELLAALEDPRFNVRFEAAISIARMPPDPRLEAALEEMLDGSELALSAIAAWALGRMADPQAIGPLRKALDSDYRSIRAQSARALGALGDREIIPKLILRLESEEDKGLAMAYASALGKMAAKGATPQLLCLLYETQNRGARMELALSLARIVGDERNFIRLLRSVRADAGTALSQGISAFRRKLGRNVDDDKLCELIDDCADQLAHENLESGEKLVGSVIRRLPNEKFSESGAEILAECAKCLDEFGSQRTEYVILALHILAVDWHEQ
jgi:HEAT repeat protein